ncbi:hypothetical protein LXL04_039960 [Taraxacum kok-saghyz]
MPQLDQFTYFTQFFWSCLFLFTFYIAICNDGDGLLGISRILKLRNQLLSHRTNNIRSKDPNSLEDILRKGFSTGLSYMYSSLFEVSQWCKAVDLLGKRRKITLISCFGEISGSRGMERNILYLISKRDSFSIRIVEWKALQERYTPFQIAPREDRRSERFSRFSIALFLVGRNSTGRERDQAEPLVELCSFLLSSLAPTVEIGGIWPPKGIAVLDPREIPFLNTLIPLSSGAAVTWAHHAILAGKEKRAVYALVATVSLALVLFSRSYVVIRQYLGHLTKEHHVGFEAAAWYWHFVDVVRFIPICSLSIGGEVYEGTNQWIEEFKLEDKEKRAFQRITAAFPLPLIII